MARRASPVFLKALRRAMRIGTSLFALAKKLSNAVLVQRGCQNARVEKRQKDKLCHRRCQKSVPSSVPDLEETAPQRPPAANAKVTKEKSNMARLPTSGGARQQNEDIRQYLSSSCVQFTIQVAHHTLGQQEEMAMVLTSRGGSIELEKRRQRSGHPNDYPVN